MSNEGQVWRVARAVYSDQKERYGDEVTAGPGQPVWRHIARAAIEALTPTSSGGEREALMTAIQTGMRYQHPGQPMNRHRMESSADAILAAGFRRQPTQLQDLQELGEGLEKTGGDAQHSIDELEALPPGAYFDREGVPWLLTTERDWIDHNGKRWQDLNARKTWEDARGYLLSAGLVPATVRTPDSRRNALKTEEEA